MENLKQQLLEIESSLIALKEQSSELDKKINDLCNLKKDISLKIKYEDLNQLNAKDYFKLLFYKHKINKIDFFDDMIKFNIRINKFDYDYIDLNLKKLNLNYCNISWFLTISGGFYVCEFEIKSSLREFIREFELDIKESGILDTVKKEISLINIKKKHIDDLYLEFE